MYITNLLQFLGGNGIDRLSSATQLNKRLFICRREK